jgi:S-DNA-T family DNA segregation ATPase FtsK/SpoIIIE
VARSAAARRARASATDGEAAGEVWAEVSGVALILVSMLATLALSTYHASDPLFVMGPVQNRAGVVGAHLAALLQRGLGWGSLVLVVGLGVVGVRLLLGRSVRGVAGRTWVGTLLAVVALAALPPLVEVVRPGFVPHADGGAVGTWLAHGERTLFSVPGALLLNGMLLVVGALCLLGIATGSAVEWVARGVGWLGAAIGVIGSALVAAIVALGYGLAQAGRSARGAGRRFALSLRRGIQAGVVWRARRARKPRVVVSPAPPEQDEPLEGTALRVASADPAAAPQRPLAVGRPKRPGELEIVDHEAQRKSKHKPEQEAFTFADGSASRPWTPPDLDLFRPPPAGQRKIDPESLTMNARILEKKLADFGVAGSVLKVHPGPVITMYEFEPASGVKVGKIVGLSDDLALALRALSVRIIAPLPAKSVVGIEVSNAERETVYLREMLASESFRNAPGKLTMALGKDIFGNPVEGNLARMPHLLVAGATGTGKSVFLNSLLCSLLFRASPDDLKLLLIDPKLLELSIYEGIPHLIADVVTNPKRAAGALAGIVQKMTERYQMMAAVGVRSIDQFNERAAEAMALGESHFELKKKPGEEEAQEVEWRRLPYIVVVVDELADLMVVCARDVEEALQRLAQMARAAGIHLVLATQRPSVDVLTGVIKANFPARISFQVSSRTDSRTILDQNGAEHLLGNGDMLFLPPGTSKLQRIHGAFVTEKEVTALVEALRSQGAPEFDETIIYIKEEGEQAGSGGDEDGDGDELYDRGVQIVSETRNASISYLQRRLKIGYNRAARMIEQMEEEGIIGPNEGTKGRQVLVPAIPAE